jgi:hypothetical protein
MSAEPRLNPRTCLLPSPRTLDGLRRRARTLAATAGSRLRLAAGRVGGDSGLALACAVVDMIEENVEPAGWPVPELIALLRDEAGRDRQVARLLADLREIENRIATLSAAPDDDDVIRRPAA